MPPTWFAAGHGDKYGQASLFLKLACPSLCLKTKKAGRTTKAQVLPAQGPYLLARQQSACFEAGFLNCCHDWQRVPGTPAPRVASGKTMCLTQCSPGYICKDIKLFPYFYTLHVYMPHTYTHFFLNYYNIGHLTHISSLVFQNVQWKRYK